MAFQIAVTQPRYHHSTDAMIGTSTDILVELGTFETFGWASHKSWLLAQECGEDSDHHFTVRDSSDLCTPLYYDPRLPQPVHSAAPMFDDDLPF